MRCVLGMITNEKGPNGGFSFVSLKAVLREGPLTSFSWKSLVFVKENVVIVGAVNGNNNKEEFVPPSINTYVLVIISGPRRKQQVKVSEMRPCRNVYVCSCVSQTKTKNSTASTHTNKIYIDSTHSFGASMQGKSRVIYYLRESYCVNLRL